MMFYKVTRHKGIIQSREKNKEREREREKDEERDRKRSDAGAMKEVIE